MGSAISQGLLITAIGMGLVFVAILFLWGLMTWLVKITADRPEKQAVAANLPDQQLTEAIEQDSQPAGTDLQKIAVIAAAIALKRVNLKTVPIPREAEPVSPWLVARRQQTLIQPASILKRKQGAK